MPKLHIFLANSLFTFWNPSGYTDLSNEVPDRVVAGVLGVRDCIFGIKENYTHMHIIYIQSNLIYSKSSGLKVLFQIISSSNCNEVDIK